MHRKKALDYNRASLRKGVTDEMRMKRVISLLLVLLLLCFSAAAEEAETVKWRSITVSRDTDYVDLGKSGVQDNQWESFYQFLQQLPNL